MSQPPPYDRQFNFQNQALLTPDDPPPADEMDSEYNAIKLTLDATLANLALIQRDDGALANDSVGWDQLKPEVDVELGPLVAVKDETIAARNDAVAAKDTAVAAAASALASEIEAETAENNAELAETGAEVALSQAQVARDAAIAAQAAAEATTASLSGTSTTSIAIGTGSKSFLTQALKAFGAGTWLLITSDANPTVDWMHGVSTVYSGTALTVDVQTVSGSGTHTDWSIRVSGIKGVDGAGTGDVTAASVFGTDERVIRSDGVGKGVQASAVALTDAGAMSGLTTLLMSGALTVGTTAATAPVIDPSGFARLPEISAPGTPASGFGVLYEKTDGKVYFKNDGGTEYDLTASGGASDFALGQCRLSKSGSNLILLPYNGNLIKINGVQEVIPDAGVTLAAPSETVTMTIASPCVVSLTGHGLAAGDAVKFSTSGALPTGITANTTYYVIAAGLTADAFEISATIGGSAINTSGTQSGTHKIGRKRYIYSYMNSGTMTLEYSSTTHATSSTAGNKGTEIKSGDNTRTLVGMAFDVATAWVDSITQRLVVSWFNRRTIGGTSYLPSTSNTSSATFAEFSTLARIEFLTWSDESVPFSCCGLFYTASASYNAITGVGFDGISAETPQAFTNALANGITFAFVGCKPGLADGYHYATILGASQGGSSTATVFGGTPNPTTPSPGSTVPSNISLAIRG